jgi:thiol:disulfide interchange protein DsbA
MALLLSKLRAALLVTFLGALLAACSHGPSPGNGGGTADGAGAATASASARNGAASEQLLNGRWLPGRNYTILSLAEPPQNLPPGKVEVTEVFWYGCPHCNAFEPYLNQWLQTKPDYVEFRRVPVMWGDIHHSHARLFYTLQVLGKLDELHDKVFAEIHQNHDLMYVAGKPQATFAAQLKFAEANGISEAAFTRAYQSAAVEADLQRAADADERYKVTSVPTMVVDRKYATDPSLAGTEQNLLSLVNDLIAKERQERRF